MGDPYRVYALARYSIMASAQVAYSDTIAGRLPAMPEEPRARANSRRRGTPRRLVKYFLRQEVIWVFSRVSQQSAYADEPRLSKRRRSKMKKVILFALVLTVCGVLLNSALAQEIPRYLVTY